MDGTKEKIGVSLIVASYNEEENIRDVLENLHRELSAQDSIDYEIFAVNDESSDTTGRIIDEVAARYDDVTAVHNERNLGLGGIFRECLARTTKEKILMVPGDGQFRADEIPMLIAQSADCDLAITYHINFYVRSLTRRALSFAFHAIVRKMFGVPYRYMNWISVYNREIFDHMDLISNRFGFRAEIVIKSHRLGYRIKEVGAHLKERETGTSSAMKLSSMLNAAFVLFKLWLQVNVFHRRRYRIRK